MTDQGRLAWMAEPLNRVLSHHLAMANNISHIKLMNFTLAIHFTASCWRQEGKSRRTRKEYFPTFRGYEMVLLVKLLKQHPGQDAQTVVACSKRKSHAIVMKVL